MPNPNDPKQIAGPPREVFFVDTRQQQQTPPVKDEQEVDALALRRQELQSRKYRNYIIGMFVVLALGCVGFAAAVGWVMKNRPLKPSDNSRAVALLTEPTKRPLTKPSSIPSGKSTVKPQQKTPRGDVTPPGHVQNNSRDAEPAKPDNPERGSLPANPRGAPGGPGEEMPKEPKPVEGQDNAIPPVRVEFKPSAPKPAKTTIPGYYVRTIAGFKVAISTLAYENSDKAKGQPLGCMESELERLREIFPAKYLKHLNTVPVFIEWDHRDVRSERALAVYYGHKGEALAWRGIEPAKQKSVCVLTLKEVYDLKSRGKRKQTILLHELAHAVDDAFFSFDSAFIENAYQQAMVRDLYKEKYASTNASEYFAEVSCAYLDQLDYKPRNAAELKEYDSVGYERMERVWGTLDAIKAEKAKDAKPKKK